VFLTEMAAKLAAESLVTTGFVVRRGTIGETQDKVIALYETGGLAPERFLGGSASVETSGLQVVVRGARDDYDTPRAQAERIYQAMLDGWGAFTQGGVRYLGVTPQQAPFLFRRDANERPYLAFNALVLKGLGPTS
jgi:hypothetical protein